MTSNSKKLVLNLTGNDSSSPDPLSFARDVLRAEAEAIVQLAEQLDDSFLEVLETLRATRGAVIATGVGKAGIIAQKISATLASTGQRSHFLHPCEAVHGDLGRVSADDAVLALSFSGESEEIVRLVPHFKALGATVVALTGNAASTLARTADHCLLTAIEREACPLGLAPSTSTTCMLALGDALALSLSHSQGFQPADFAQFHPGGSLGRKLALVDEVMRPLQQCRLAHCDQSLREALVHVGKPGRRTGAIMLLDDQQRLAGIFTDSDLARLLEEQPEEILTAGMHAVMTRAPRTIESGSRLQDALVLLRKWKISELPVVDSSNRPIGLIDITDVVGIAPDEAAEAQSPLRRSA